MPRAGARLGSTTPRGEGHTLPASLADELVARVPRLPNACRPPKTARTLPREGVGHPCRPVRCRRQPPGCRRRRMRRGSGPTPVQWRIDVQAGVERTERHERLWARPEFKSATPFLARYETLESAASRGHAWYMWFLRYELLRSRDWVPRAIIGW